MLHVKFSGVLQRIAARETATLELPASGRLSDALAALDQAYPGILGSAAEYQWRHGSTRVLVAINGQLVEQDEEQAMLKDEDQIMLFPAIGGGVTDS